MAEPRVSERPFQVIVSEDQIAESIVITPDMLPHKGWKSYGTARVITVDGTGPEGTVNNPFYDPSMVTATPLPDGTVAFTPNAGYSAVELLESPTGQFEIGAVVSP
jgi:hypothetical protein